MERISCFIHRNDAELKNEIEKRGIECFFLYSDSEEYIGVFHHPLNGWVYSSALTAYREVTPNEIIEKFKE